MRNLIDYDWLPKSRLQPRPGLVRRVREAIPQARRYVFDRDACIKVGLLLRDAMDLVVEQMEFARNPYPVTYIEMADQAALFHSWKDADASDSQDVRVGFLMIQDHQYVFAATATKDALIGLFNTRFERPQSYPLDQIFGDYGDAVNAWQWPQAGVYPAGTPLEAVMPQQKPWQQAVKLAYLLGGHRDEVERTNVYMPQGVDLEDVERRFDLQPTFEVPRSLHKDMFENAFLGSGDMIITVAALLLLNLPRSGVSMTQVPHHRGIHKGKSVVFHKHTTVHIHLDPKNDARRLLLPTGERASPRRHDVAAHWVHWHRVAGCIHDYQPIDQLTPHKRYRCTGCGALRTRREGDGPEGIISRGSGERGIITKDYEVSP